LFKYNWIATQQHIVPHMDVAAAAVVSHSAFVRFCV